MTRKRVLVSQTRFPEIDRDTGSQRVDMFIHWLRARGWSVTFMATETDGDPRHARRLQQLGIPTYAGCEDAEEMIATGEFDLAVLAFWKSASRLLPILRSVSPQTRVVVDSIDLHFLRTARRILVADEELDEQFSADLAAELNAYRAADAVLTVSDEETNFLGEFLGTERIFDLPLAASVRRSRVPFEERSGMVFVGNFRHLPNGEAVEYLCQEVLPRLSPELLAKHPVHVVGSRLGEAVAAHGSAFTNVKMVGWVPSVVPYLESARVSVVPLLHGAGVKGKVVESLMAGTPVVTTTLGAEGMDVRHGEHLLIGDTPQELADALAWALSDEAQWQRMADAGYAHAAATHAPERVEERFFQIIDGVLPRSGGAGSPGDGDADEEEPDAEYRAMKEEVEATLRSITRLGEKALVVSRGDDALLSSETARHFPQTPDGEWAGFSPGDSAAVIEQLEALRDRGARYFLVPSHQFWWLHYYNDLNAHLEAHYRRIRSCEHLVLFDLAPEPPPATPAVGDTERAERVLVLGTYEAERSAPPARLVQELARSDRFDVSQHWRRQGEAASMPGDGADWILHVDSAAVLPNHFVDRFLGVVTSLVELGVERAQPAHMNGPDGGPPATERLRGILGREVETTLPLPVLAVRAGAAPEGPTALVDAVPIGLTEPLPDRRDPLEYSLVRDVFAPHPDGARRSVQRSNHGGAPRISVLIATYERPDLLAGCLEGFCDQTLPANDLEVVVVDDGSEDAETETVLRAFASRLPLTWTRIDHAGRSAAKNLALLLARSDLVLFFDDDDRPAPDLLVEHLRAHERHAGEATAVLGYTGWDPQVEVSPLMHYLTEVDRLLFSYGKLTPGQVLDWRGFWEGRVSSKRSLHVRHGLHDQRLEYSIDVELAWRLRKRGLAVVYQPAARSVMSRPLDLDEFRRRYEAKGRAQAAMALLHDDPEIRDYTKVDGASKRWQTAWHEIPQLKERIAELEHALNGGGNGAGHEHGRADVLAELHRCYRKVFFAHNAKGIAGVKGDPGEIAKATPAPSTNGNGSGPAAELNGSGAPAAQHRNGSEAADETPELSIVVPVWSRTEELAEMAARTIYRVWEVARLRTEVIVIDNGSPVERPLRARVHRFEDNRGVASAWNTGIDLARAPVIAVLNSDCVVEPGWDEALYEAATTGRRIAFPYTDHCDGEGFRQPDQGGTAGWCFMLTRELFEEIGTFDERFNPAYGEDTDYWHRAWENGIELSPVPAARVRHRRRSSVTEDDGAEMLLLAHRYKYGWKHGVDPTIAPPYYNREIVEYHCTSSEPASASPA